MNRKDLKVDEYINTAKSWKDEIIELRRIMLETGLNEFFKWAKPTYMFEDYNIGIIQSFKNYIAFMFFKGSLLKDPNNILIKPGENSQAGRQVRFTNTKEIFALEPVLKKYVKEAIEIEKAGLKVEKQTAAELVIPEELKTKFKNNPRLEMAFSKLTKGRQRAYIIYFTGAKKTKTRLARIDKYISKILDGKGMND